MKVISSTVISSALCREATEGVGSTRGVCRTWIATRKQLWLTLFAKAPEITLFDFRQLQRPIRATDRAEWQGSQTSFDFDEMLKPIQLGNGTTSSPHDDCSGCRIHLRTSGHVARHIGQSDWHQELQTLQFAGRRLSAKTILAWREFQWTWCRCFPPMRR